MPYIAVPRQQTTQPKSLVQLNERHPLYQDIVLAYSAGRGPSDGRHGAGSVVGAVTRSIGTKGKGLIPSDASSYVNFPYSADYNTLGEVTIVAVIRTTTLIMSQQGLLTRCETGGGTNTPWALLMEASQQPAFNRSNSGFRVWRTNATLTDNTDYVIAVSQGADISVAPRFYINGAYDTSGTTSLYGGSGSGAPTGNTTSAKLGNRTDLATQSSTIVYDAVVFKRVLTDRQIADLSRNIHDIWKAPDRQIWVTVSASSDGVGSATGTSTASGVGASVNAQPGTSAGTSTVSGVGASTAASVASSSGTGTASGVGNAVIESVGSAAGASTVSGVGTSGTGSSGSASGTSSVAGVGAAVTASVGSSDGLALASGVGASVATSTGTSSGTSTVSGVGDSTQPGSSVGTAVGTSTVSGVGASVVAAVGSASGSSTVTGRGGSTGGEVEGFGGDDAPIIIRKRKKKTLREQPNKHLEHILNTAIDEFQGRSKPTLTLKKNKELEQKEVVSTPGLVSKEIKELGAEKALAVPSLLDAQKDAEKVAQLLAEYQQQVRAMEDDEDLIMLIAEFYG